MRLCLAIALVSLISACSNSDSKGTSDFRGPGLTDVAPGDGAPETRGVELQDQGRFEAMDLPSPGEVVDALSEVHGDVVIPLDVAPEVLLPDEDEDHDGISNGAELAAGTDPFDPASAAMWHPEWTGFPRLVFGADAVPALQAKALAPGARGAAMLARVKATADAVPLPPRQESYDPYHEVSRARVAMAAAFMALLFDDLDYAAKAAEIAVGLNPNVHEVGFDSPYLTKTSIHAGEAIALYAKMYDWLKGSALLSKSDLLPVADAVLALTRQFETQSTKGPLAAVLVLAQNNHNVKAYGAIGLAGMVFFDAPEAARWVHRGVTEVRYYFLDYQTTTDGGYAEGPNYLNYCLGEGLSMLWAYHRFAQGEATYLRHFYDTREQLDVTYEWVSDPLLEPLLKELFLWPLRIMLPGGQAPNVDDASLSAVSGGYLSVLFHDPVFLWHWELPGVGRPSHSGIDLAADIFALLDEEVEGSAPDFGPDVFLEEAGNCVMRSGFGAQDRYVMLLGEHGKVRQHGQGHEHPDASQLLIHDQGEYLLMDSGYIGYDDKEPVAHAQNHNLILVNGKGPPDSEYTGIGSDTFLSDYSDAVAGFRSCRSATSYQETEFSRDVVVAPRGMVIVADHFSRVDEAELEILWHGNALGEEFSREAGKAAWQRPNATLHGFVVSSIPAMECDSLTQTHSFHHGVALEHETLRCRTIGATGHFITLFEVVPPQTQPHEIKEVSVANQPQFAGLLALGGDGATLVTYSPEATFVDLDDALSCGLLPVESGLTVTTFGPACSLPKSVNIP